MQYEEFVKRLEERPSGISPLRFVATMHDRPAEASEWLIRWLKEQRA